MSFFSCTFTHNQMCILTAWLKPTQCVCVARTHSIFMPSTMCVLIVCWLRPRSVLLLFLSVVYLFSSLSYLYSDQHFLSNVNSVEGINHCAFAQRGVLPPCDIPSSHNIFAALSPEHLFSENRTSRTILHLDTTPFARRSSTSFR